MPRGFLILLTLLLAGPLVPAQDDKPLEANPAEDLFTLATVAYQDKDSDIDFYDTTFGLVSFGMFYRFD